MGTHYYCVCHTCLQSVSLGRKIWRFDPRSGVLNEEEIARLTSALEGRRSASELEGVRRGELAFELAMLGAFVFEHGHHELEIITDSTDDLSRFTEVMKSSWDAPLAHRREEAPKTMVPRGTSHSDAMATALGDIATMCGCSTWEYPGQVVRDVQRALAKAVHDCVPCQSCGADPRVSPPTDQELPIIKGALDAQADAERRAMAAEDTCTSLRAELTRRDAALVSACNMIVRHAASYDQFHGEWGSGKWEAFQQSHSIIRAYFRAVPQGAVPEFPTCIVRDEHGEGRGVTTKEARANYRRYDAPTEIATSSSTVETSDGRAYGLISAALFHAIDDGLLTVAEAEQAQEWAKAKLHISAPAAMKD